MVKAVDLDRFPAVETLLKELGCGPFKRGTITAPFGRNDSWAGETESGEKVFVKRMLGHPMDVSMRMERILSFERFVGGNPFLQNNVPAYIGSDRDAGIVVFRYVEDARSGAELVVGEEFGDELAETAGRLVGLLHRASTDGAGGIDESPPAMPAPELLHGLPVEILMGFSYGEVEAWRLMQQDTELVEALLELRRREQEAPRVPAHCDFRLDQLLLGDEMYVTDWEEFRLADPARDVGSFAGEWLYRSVLDITTNRGDGDSAFLDLELTHEMVLRRGVEKMERLLPRVHHFWQAYRAVRPEVDEGFTTRATAFAGWHLLDRLVAGAATRQRLSAVERAAAGVGRTALLTPHKFTAALGFEEAA